MLLTLLCLKTYAMRTHSEDALFVCGYCIVAFVISTIIFAVKRREERFAPVAWIFSTLVLAFVFYVGTKIPFCPVCDKVTEEELGSLIYWITPE